MSGAVRSRRTASVTLSGSSNLPADKLNTLSASINKILQVIVDVFNACEDSNISQQEKFHKMTAGTKTLGSDIDWLLLCLGEEMNICSEAIRNGMRPKFTEASQNGNDLKHLINQYSESSPNRVQTAKSIFERLMMLVNDAIDLLKLADEHFVERLISEANSALVYLKLVRDAINVGELVVVTQDYVPATVRLAKRLSKRIESGVLPKDVIERAKHALGALQNESAAVVNAKRNYLSFPTDQAHANDLDLSIRTMTAAIQTTLEIGRMEPNFAVDFQVDYVDDDFGFLLAKLGDAVDASDQSNVVSLLGQIIRAVSNRSIDSGLSQDDPKIKQAKSDLVETRDTSQQCLQFKQSNNQVSAHDAQIHFGKATKQLRHSFHALVSRASGERTSLRAAARQIIANLDKLVV